MEPPYLEESVELVELETAEGRSATCLAGPKDEAALARNLAGVRRWMREAWIRGGPRPAPSSQPTVEP